MDPHRMLAYDEEAAAHQPDAGKRDEHNGNKKQAKRRPESVAEIKFPKALHVNAGANVVVVVVVRVTVVVVTVVPVTVVVVLEVGVVLGEVVGEVVGVDRSQMSVRPAWIEAMAAFSASTPIGQCFFENESTAPTCNCALPVSADASKSCLLNTTSMSRLAIRPAVRSLSTLNVPLMVDSQTTLALKPKSPSTVARQTSSKLLRRVACTSQLVSPGTNTLPNALHASCG